MSTPFHLPFIPKYSRLLIELVVIVISRTPKAAELQKGPERIPGMAPITGEIKGLAVPWLFQGLHAGKKTGTVIFARDTTAKKVFISQGDLIFASSNLKEDRLGELLLRTGAITKEQFDASSELVMKTGKKQGRVLVELGFLDPKGLVVGVKSQVRQIIDNLLAWQDGYYIFDEGPLPDSDIIPLQMSIGNLIIEGLRGTQWDEALAPFNTIIRPVSDPSLLFQSADLDQDQRKVLSLVDGKTSIEEICCVSGIGDPIMLKALYVLLALRMVETGGIKNEADREFVCRMVAEHIPIRTTAKAITIEFETAADPVTPQVQASAKAIAAQVPTTAAPVLPQARPDDIPLESLADMVAAANTKPEMEESALQLTKEDIQDAYDGLAIQNFYEVLGVDHTTAAPGIKNAYFNLTKRYHPDQAFRPALREMKEKLDALKNAFDEAYETLIDKTKRERYNLDLASGVKKRVAVEGAQTARPARKTAIEYFGEGMKLFNEGDYWTAEESFQEAVGLDPRNAQFIFYRGLALSRVPRRGREAEEFFVRAVELAPANSVYNLELGNFYAKYGLKAKALSVYRDALKYDPKSEKIKQAMKKIGE
jgi:tetratricopeptide (TPR) repeat protein